MQNPFHDDILAHEATVFDGGPGDEPSLHASIVRHLASEIADASARGFEITAGERGGTILLTAPRAGYGKSHVLAQLALQLGDTASFVNVRFNHEEAPGWETLRRQTLAAFGTPAPSGALIHHLFGTLAERLCEDGVDTGPAHAHVRDWLAKPFEALRPAMTRRLAKARGVTDSGAAFWLDFLREASVLPDEELPPLLERFDAEPSDGENAARVAKRRLGDFCRIATFHRPIVFIFEHLDCFHGDLREGLRLASLLAELRDLSPGQTAIIALNDDLWQSIFDGRLPSALADRLTVEPLRLPPLRTDAARDLIAARCRAAGIPEDTAAHFLAGFDLGAEPELSPRAVLRKARRAWNRFMGAEEPEGLPPSSVPAPITEGFPGGLLGDFGLEIPSVADLMDAETLRRAREHARPAEGDAFPSAGTSPFLHEPDDSYLNGPHSLHSILKSVPPPDDEESALPALWKSGELLASLRDKAAPAPENPRLPPPRPPRLPQPPSAVSRLHPLVARFQELRDGFFQNAGAPFPVAQIRELVSLCGAQSPLIASSEILLPGSTDGTALRWLLPGQMILLAFAEGGDSAFWPEFFRFAGEEGQRGAKLVVFAPSESAFPEGCGLDPADLPDPVRSALDVVPLGRDALATLRAAATLLADSAAIAPATPGEALGVLSEELDFFWRRLTRPLVSA